jgi:flavin-dependent dehydrogenase
MRRVDVLVAGAGPAGSALACRLARTGVGVDLVDASSFPREKLCGEFYSPEIRAELRELGVYERASLGSIPIISTSLHPSRGPTVHAAFDPAGFGLSRLVFDDILRCEAERHGARWHPRTRVIGAVRRDRCVVVRLRREDTVESVEARVLVDATGRGMPGAIARPPEARRWVGVRARFRSDAAGPEPAPAASSELAMFSFSGGYVGVSPIARDTLNLCALVRADLVRSAATPLALLRGLVCEHDGLREHLTGFVQSGEVHATARLWFGWAGAPGPAVPIGDAAGSIPPIAGNGIAMALRSAGLAETAVRSLLSGSSTWEDTLRSYERSWKREFGRRVQVGTILHRAALSPKGARVLSTLARHVPHLSDWITRTTRAHSDRG